jgi:glutamyl endopeptidase
MSRLISKFAAAVAVGASMFSMAGIGAASADAVSSDGKVVKSIPESAGGGTPYAGTGILPGTLASRYASTEGVLLDPIPSNNIKSESVIGTDGRVRITGTTTYPYRAITHITFSSGGSTYGCTGWFISANTIATAGHCVHTGSGGSAGWYSASTYRIYPGRNGSYIPYGYCTARQLWTNASWTNGGGHTVDYAAIKLNCTTGNTVGWFGRAVASTLTGRPVRISGYPGDKPYGTQWMMGGSITSETSSKAYYTIDTYGGQSGAPVYQTFSNGPYGLAIHAYGGNPNSGTRINSIVNNFLASIISKP